jgi:hypothetical protein
VLDAGDVHRRPGARELGLVRRQRGVDALVLLLRPFDRTLLRDAAPHPGARRRGGDRVDEGREHRVARAQGDPAVEFGVEPHHRLDRRRIAHLVQQRAQCGEVLLADLGSGQRGRRRLQHAPHPEQVEDLVGAMEVDDEGHGFRQPVGLHARHVGPVALAHVDDVDQRERPDRLAQRVARDLEPRGQVGLLR